MKFLKLNVYASEFGMDKVKQLFGFKGMTETKVENETAETVIGKFVIRKKNDEYVVTGYYADDEEGRKEIADFKVLCMMLKSKELYGDFGMDANTGRLYAEDVEIDETNWNDL